MQMSEVRHVQPALEEANLAEAARTVAMCPGGGRGLEAGTSGHCVAKSGWCGEPAQASGNALPQGWIC